MFIILEELTSCLSLLTVISSIAWLSLASDSCLALSSLKRNVIIVKIWQEYPWFYNVTEFYVRNNDKKLFAMI